jgi:hypothetical protein
MLLKLTIYIPLLENLSLKNWWQDSREESATLMIIELSLYSAVEKSMN